jgi:hypothetical protein
LRIREIQGDNPKGKILKRERGGGEKGENINRIKIRVGERKR